MIVIERCRKNKKRKKTNVFAIIFAKGISKNVLAKKGKFFIDVIIVKFDYIRVSITWECKTKSITFLSDISQGLSMPCFIVG